MTEPIKVTPVVRAATGTQQIEYVIQYFFGALEILLAFRLILKLAGASLSSGFVRAIYSLSNIFVWPFEGIFRKGFAQGVETMAILEPATLVAIAVYGVVAWGIVKLVRISSGEQQVD
jgi:hypothetical protein